jgi:hypothetical protein
MAQAAERGRGNEASERIPHSDSQKVFSALGKNDNKKVLQNTIHTLMKRFALVSKPRVVCLEASEPRGTMPLSFSRQIRKCARLKQAR